MGLVVIMVILANNIKNKSLSPILMLAARPSFVMDMKKILNNSSPLANNKFIKTVKIINIKTGFIEAITVFNESLLKALIAIRTTNHKKYGQREVLARKTEVINAMALKILALGSNECTKDWVGTYCPRDRCSKKGMKTPLFRCSLVKYLPST